MNYNKIYNDLIEKAKSRILEGYQEKHHIIPKCLGGDDNLDNIVGLTPEEHYIAHLLLVKIYPNQNGLVFAAWYMQYHNSDKRKNNKSHGWLQRLHGQSASLRSTNMWKNKDKRDSIIHSMITERNSLIGKSRIRESAQRCWDAKDVATRNLFKDTMKVVNKDPIKRKKAGEKIKAKWSDPEFNIKMKNRKTRGSDGSALTAKWADPIWKANMLEKRRLNKLKRLANETI